MADRFYNRTEIFFRACVFLLLFCFISIFLFLFIVVFFVVCFVVGLVLFCLLVWMVGSCFVPFIHLWRSLC